MKKNVKQLILGIVALSIVLLSGLAITSGAFATNTNSDTTAISTPSPQIAQTATTTTSSSSDAGVIEQFGPPGVIITTVLTGILLIVKARNEGKAIDVTTYKERAVDAETRSNEEIAKVHKKLEELEGKLDEVIADRDSYRNTLEERKAHFTQQVLDIEKRHQRELEDMHAALMIEVHTRHRLERLLVQNGIQVPDTPPPYTKDMKDAVTPKEAREAEHGTASMRIIREQNEKNE